MKVIRQILISAMLVAACAPVAPSGARPTESATSLASTPAPTPAPRPTLPGGLQVRPGMPALVDGEADPCLPLCRAQFTTAGPFKVGERYQTKYFFGGYMTLEPKRAWTGGEDSTGELGMFQPAEDYGVKFAMDLYPVKDQVRVTDVPNTADGLVGWLRDHPHYDMSEEIQATIGTLPATAVDVWNSPETPSQYEDCLGEPCSDMFSFEQYHDNGGILGDDIYRFYFADVEFSGSRHVFIVIVEARDRADLDARIPAVEELLATVTVPAHAA